MMSKSEMDRLHERVHKDPVGAWPEVRDLIDAPDRAAPTEWLSGLLEDLCYSEMLPVLIDWIEEQASISPRFAWLLVFAAPVLGGRGGPEMDRIFNIIRAVDPDSYSTFLSR